MVSQGEAERELGVNDLQPRHVSNQHFSSPTGTLRLNEQQLCLLLRGRDPPQCRMLSLFGNWHRIRKRIGDRMGQVQIHRTRCQSESGARELQLMPITWTGVKNSVSCRRLEYTRLPGSMTLAGNWVGHRLLGSGG